MLLAPFLIIGMTFYSNPLGDLRWKYRVLLVSGPATLVEEQLNLLETSPDELEDRNLLVFDLNKKIQSLPEGRIHSDDVKSYFGLDGNDFRVLLIGKDGGVKINSTQFVKPIDLFATIDRMPMRQAEMRQRN